jgi:hypothetical protein
VSASGVDGEIGERESGGRCDGRAGEVCPCDEKANGVVGMVAPPVRRLDAGDFRLVGMTR